MTQLAIVLILSIIFQICTAPPVTQKKEEGEKNENEIGDGKETGLVSFFSNDSENVKFVSEFICILIQLEQITYFLLNKFYNT